jgi:hypothetical protein
MEIFCRNTIILAFLTIPLTEIKIIFTNLINHLLSYEYGWLQKKRELSEKVLSNFIKFL